MLGGGCFSPLVWFVQTFSVVGTGEPGVTGKWIGITKEVANNKRKGLSIVGDQEKDPDDAELGYK
jgi:hypothetical protein